MSVRLRVLLIVGVAAVALITMLYASSRYLILNRFVNLESLEANKTTAAVQRTFREEIDRLNLCNTDLSVYDATYDSMPKPTKEYLDSVLGEGPNGWLEQKQVNFLVITDADGKIVAADGFDLGGTGTVDVPEDLKAHLRASSRLVEFRGPADTNDGLLLLASGPVLVAAHPIVPITPGLRVGR
jgi:sensor domain CHASE-containing protein